MVRLRDAAEQAPWDQVIRWMTATLVIAVVIAVVIAALRARNGRNGRRGRVEYALLPSPEFETTTEDVIRFASQLGRARRATGLTHHADANSVRIRLRSVGESECLMTIAIPETAGSGVRRAMYPDVETRPIDDVITSLEGPSIASGNGRSQDLVGSAPAGPPRAPLSQSAPADIGPTEVEPPPRVNPPPRVGTRPQDEGPRGVDSRPDQEIRARGGVALWVDRTGGREPTSPSQTEGS